MFDWLLWLWVLSNCVHAVRLTEDQGAALSPKRTRRQAQEHESNIQDTSAGYSRERIESVTVIHEKMEDFTNPSSSDTKRVGDILQKSLVSNDKSKVELHAYRSSHKHKRPSSFDDRDVLSDDESSLHSAPTFAPVSEPPDRRIKKKYSKDTEFQLFDNDDNLDNDEEYDDDFNDDDDDDDDDSFLDQMQSDYVPGLMNKGKGSSSKMKKKNRRLQSGQRLNWKEYSNEYRIKHKLTMHYDKTTRPVRNDNTTTDLYIGMSLYHILDTVSNLLNEF